jgi:hypothetical protein
MTQQEETNLINAASEFVAITIQAANPLLKSKRLFHYCLFFFSTFVILCWGRYSTEPRDANGLRSYHYTIFYINAANLFFMMSMHVVARFWPIQTHRWLGLVPVLVALRWDPLESPSREELKRYVAEAIRWRGKKIHKEFADHKQRCGTIGYVASQVHALVTVFECAKLCYWDLQYRRDMVLF